MKLGAIQTTQPYTYKKNNHRKIASQPAFKARVELELYMKEPFLKLAKLVTPALLKLDENIRIKIQEAKVWRMFRPDLSGLKYDVEYIDQKIAYLEVLERNKENPFLKPQTLKALIDKDEKLLFMFSKPGRVGYVYDPKKLTEEQFVANSLYCVKSEIYNMPKELLEHPKGEWLADGTFYIDHCDEMLFHQPYNIYK